MANPFSDWATISTDKAYTALPKEEREVLRQNYVSNISGGDKKVQQLADFATRDLETEVFNSKEFHDADEDTQRDAIKANLLANGRLSEDMFAPRMLGSSHGDSVIKGVMKKYRADAIVAGVKKPIYAAAQLAGLAQKAVGMEEIGNRTIQDANEGIREATNLQERAPIAGKTSEILASLGVGFMTGGPVGNIAKNWMVKRGVQAAAGGVVTAATNPTEVAKGTPEQETEDLIEGKKQDLVLGAATQGVVDAATAKSTTNIIGDMFRAFKKDRVADSADDLLRTFSETDAQEVSKLKAKGVDTSKMTPEQLLEAVKKEKDSLAASDKAFMYTGAEAGQKSNLGKMQMGVKKTNPEQIIKEAIEGNDHYGAMPLAEVFEKADTSMVPGEASEYVRKKYLPKAVQESAAEKIALTNAAKQEAAEESNLLFGNARTSGVLSEPIDVSKNDVANMTKKFFKRPENRYYGVEGLPVVQQMLAKTGKKETLDLTADDIVKRGQALREAITPQNGEIINRLIDELEAPLASSASDEIAGLYAANREIQDGLKAKLAGINSMVGIERGIETTFAKEPIKKAFSLNTGARSVADAFLDGNTTHDEIADIMHDQVLGKHLRTAISADIADTLNVLKTKKAGERLGLQELAARYAGREEEVLSLFEDSPEIQKAFSDLMDAGTATGNIRREFATKSGEEVGKGGASYGTKALGGELSGVRTGVFTLVDAAAEAFNKKTRTLIRDSFTDKDLALKILDKAEKIQAGRVKYADMWDKFQGARAITSNAARIPLQQQDSAPMERPQPSEEELPEVDLPGPYSFTPTTD